jgi:hypothetical protein
MSFNGNLQPSGDAGEDLTTKGDLHGYSTENTRLPVGADTNILQANSATSTGLEWIVAGGGGLEFLTITTGTTTNPTHQTGNATLIADLRDVSAGALQVEVDGAKYGQALPSGNGYSFAVSPSSSLALTSFGSTDMTAAVLSQTGNKGNLDYNNKFGLWASPDGYWWTQTGTQYASYGRLYGANPTTSAWDVSTQTDNWHSYLSTGSPDYAVPLSSVCFDYTVNTGGVRSAGGGNKYICLTDNSGGGGSALCFTSWDSSGNPWLCAGASYSSVSGLLTTPDNDQHGLHMDETNARLYTTGDQNNKVYQYSVSGAEASTVNTTPVSDFDYSSETTNAKDVSVSGDGKYMIVMDAGGDVYGYNLSSPFDCASASLDGTFSTSAQTSDICGCQISYSADMVYVLDDQYSASYLNFILGYTTTGTFTGSARVGISS